MLVVPVILWDRTAGAAHEDAEVDGSALKAAVLRFARHAQVFAPALVSTQADNAARVERALAETGSAVPRLLVEPGSRDTATAAALAAEILAREGPHRLGLLISPDLLPAAPDEILAALPEACALARSGRLVTFGRPGGNSGAEEVPDSDQHPALSPAGTRTASGTESWRGGTVMFRAGTLLSEFEQHAPDILRACREALRGVTLTQSRIDPSRDAFARLRPASLDGAILHRSRRAARLAPSGWTGDAAGP